LKLKRGFERVESSRGIDYRYSGWGNFSKYETALERQIYKAAHELERLQRMRLGEKLPPLLVLDVDVSNDSSSLIPKSG
jgi:hypothetical protein